MTTQQQCIDRLNRMLNNVPPIRYTPPSPYPNYSQYQLDMRRKAEILKYSNNASSTKTNNPTKKQLYSHINVQATNGNNAISLTDQCSNTDDGATTPLPNYYSGVPGPVMMLFYDKNIPLYKYSSIKPTYSAQEGEPTERSL